MSQTTEEANEVYGLPRCVCHRVRCLTLYHSPDTVALGNLDGTRGGAGAGLAQMDGNGGNSVGPTFQFGTSYFGAVGYRMITFIFDASGHLLHATPPRAYSPPLAFTCSECLTTRCLARP
jgi:hypothetical protein